MNKHLISILGLIAYCLLLIKVMVFKNLPTIKIGQIMLNFGGTDAGHAPNFVPFATILPYLLGHKGLLIAGVNLVGNIILLIPIGFLVPLVYRNMTWKKSLALAVVAGLTIEVTQVILRVGIFDIDDVILNAFGVMIGYWTFVFLGKWVRERNYKNIVIAAVVVMAAMAAAVYFVYPWGQPVNRGIGAGGVQSERFIDGESEVPQSGDLCGGTGGNGQIVSLGDSDFTLQIKDGDNQTIHLTDQATIETSAGPATMSDLKIGDRVTLVGGPNPDGSFTAEAVFVCSPTASN